MHQAVKFRLFVTQKIGSRQGRNEQNAAIAANYSVAVVARIIDEV